jgi:CDP-paratose 2-epimerase
MTGGRVLITGGAGFIGSNLADRLAGAGRDVVLFDNYSRPGVERNTVWLCSTHPSRVRIEIGDVRSREALGKALDGVSEVFHFAAQVAVTTSLTDPVADFDVNARGTLNLLEEIRRLDRPPSLVFTSTNKVYGDLPDLELRRNGTRYYPAAAATAALGVSERQPLSFHSPYGCSKGAADQYVCDYARVYGLAATVFRMSCIYGPHQLGTEDQGWVAHFLIRAVEGKPLTIYGDGMQVRDVLFIEDLVDAFILAQDNMATVGGRAFNIGGGPANTVSLTELMDRIGELHGEKPHVQFEPWRTGDQRYYVSDTRAFGAATGWAPQIPVRDGVRALYEWLLAARGISRPRALAGGGS